MILTIYRLSPSTLHHLPHSSRIKDIQVRYPRDQVLEFDHLQHLVSAYPNIERLSLVAAGIKFDPRKPPLQQSQILHSSLKMLRIYFHENSVALYCLLRCLIPSSKQTRIHAHGEFHDRQNAYRIGAFLSLSMLRLDPFVSINWLSILQSSPLDGSATPYVQLQLGYCEEIGCVGQDPYRVITINDPGLHCLSRTFVEAPGIISQRSTSIKHVRIQIDEPVQMVHLLNALKAVPNIISLAIVLRQNADLTDSIPRSPLPILVARLPQLQELTVQASRSDIRFQTRLDALDRLFGYIMFPDEAEVDYLLD